jgi:hypothetical protein
MKKIISNLLFLIVFSYSISLSFLNPYNKKLFYNNEVYFIKSLFNNHYFNIKNNKLILSEKLSQIRFLETRTNTYFIDINKFYRIGINENNQIIIYNKYKNIKNINKIKMYWNFIKIKDNQYIIKNLFNEKYIMVNNQQIKFSDKINISEKNINKIFLFNIIKLFELGNFNNKNENNIIEKEPIDVLIKYIDLNDKTLNRKGIKQFYKDFDNEELRYSIRSILQYIPWIRKIFILMPNKKVKYFKSAKKIKDKIIYIKDKDLLGFDSANIYAFTFNLYKMGKFGISKNFIYMEDDFFIGKPLNKSDFFYYDIKKKKVFPYILTDYFTEIDIYQTLKEYNNLFKKKNSFHPHSGLGWKFSLLSTDKYFFERYTIFAIFEQTDFLDNETK